MFLGIMLKSLKRIRAHFWLSFNFKVLNSDLSEWLRNSDELCGFFFLYSTGESSVMNMGLLGNKNMSSLSSGAFITEIKSHLPLIFVLFCVLTHHGYYSHEVLLSSTSFWGYGGGAGFRSDG